MMLSVDDSLIVLLSDFFWVWKAIDLYLRRKLSEAGFWEVHDDYLHWMVFGNDSHQSCFRVKQKRIMLVENQPKSFHNPTITGNVTISLKPEA